MSKQEFIITDPMFFPQIDTTVEDNSRGKIDKPQFNTPLTRPTPAIRKVDKKAVGDKNAILDKKTTLKKNKNKTRPGSTRGIETMFRTAYRSQLDLIALAATKANIMISLNGIILSVLTLSGPFVLVAEPLFVAPIAVFLATCLCSIFFAVLAAQPHSLKRESNVDDFKKDRANILVFEHFASLTREEHSKLMLDSVKKNDRIYKNMAWQLYLFGITADRKFRLLKISYSSFLIGLILSTVMLLIVIVAYHTIGLTEIMGFLKSRTLPIESPL
jgi:hypothetical protein